MSFQLLYQDQSHNQETFTYFAFEAGTHYLADGTQLEAGTDKTAPEWLARASEGTEADELELAVIRLVDRAVRSSSPVECVNSRIRLVQVARKRLSEDFIYLLAVYHNLKAFGRGTVREGATPAGLAGIALPTDDWLELLDLGGEAPHDTEYSSA